MSVLTLSPEIFNYMRAGITKAAYNRTVDDFYYYPISRYFEDKDIEKECLRLVRSWADLNLKSYCYKYKDTFESIAPFIRPDFTKMPLTAIQLCKYVECLSYNIEPEHWELSEQEKQDLNLLNELKRAIHTAIIGSLPEYKAANWSN